MKQLHIFKIKCSKATTLILFLLLVGLQGIFAQQDSQFTQYMYNTSTINPAYAGSQEELSAVLLYRNQWLGLDGAPETLNFTAQSQLSAQAGAAITFLNDKIGPSNESSITADYSYTVGVGQNYNLAFGLKGGVNLFSLDYSLLTVFNPDDVQFQQNIDNRLSPIVGAGVYFYNDTFYMGLSVPSILSTTFYDDESVSTARTRPAIYYIMGYVFELNDDLLFKPAFLTKAENGAPIAFDLSANFLYNEKFTIGAAYRFGNAFSALTGFQINDNFQIGYAYDYNTTALGNFSGGSHEIFLRFSLGYKRDDRLLEPRFF